MRPGDTVFWLRAAAGGGFVITAEKVRGVEFHRSLSNVYASTDIMLDNDNKDIISISQNVIFDSFMDAYEAAIEHRRHQ